MGLSHLDDKGAARMVDVGAKPITTRRAVAEAWVELAPATLELIAQDGLPKGDALAVARLAGIMAAKKTPDLIPLCHPLPLNGVSLELTPQEGGVLIQATASTNANTGVEMEAMTAAAVAALALYDMVKGVDRGARLGRVQLLLKEGGKSGLWRRED
ncbi:MAG: cyclic pyranopterin monophosphate synthase MoaC [Desulfarculaceae bacterium]|nr:cyclic pyranopterin monophosphate synthase MoaC [Desulfarculaceae bacterium]